jgi:hypothetical protein
MVSEAEINIVAIQTPQEAETIKVKMKEAESVKPRSAKPSRTLVASARMETAMIGKIVGSIDTTRIISWSTARSLTISST